MSSFIEDYNRWKKTGKFDEEKKDKKSIAKTGVTGANYVGQGVLKGAESIFVDTPLLIAGGIRKLFGDDKGANDLFEASNVSLTNMAINKLSGNEANPYLNNNQNLFNEELDKNSLIKENNIGGKVAQGVGEMLPTIALAGGLNGVGKVAKTAKQLDTARKVGANTLLGAKAFSGATNEAYQESGDIGKSMLYGLGNAGVEIATEQISGGIPGLKQIKGDTTKNILKNYGKSVIGEGVEEVAADLANPLLKTIYQGKDALKQYGNADYWKGVAESGVVGAATGAILDIPNTASSLKTNKVGKNTQINRVVTQGKNNSAEISQKEASQGTKVNLPINTNQDAEIVKNKVNLPPIQSDLNQQITQMRENEINLPKIDQNEQKISNQINEIENKVNNLSDNSATFTQDNKTINEIENNTSLQTQLENNLFNQVEEGIDRRKAMLESFKEYLEEHNITNPTQKDINDSIVDVLSYDNDLDYITTQNYEKEYNQVANEYIKELQNDISSFNLKENQLDIINNSNPMQDDYHTGIRNVNDIKTLEETLNDSDYIDYDEFNPDLTRQDIENAIKKGTITVYSSYPIENGVFVSPSKMEAESYSGNGKVYSKEVPIQDIAWIDPTQGQYAKVNNNSNENSKNYSNISNSSFDDQIDLLINNQWNKNASLILFKETPKLYQDLGLSNKEITVSPSKMKEIIYGNKNHIGIGVDNAKALPGAISNPLNIIESTTRDNSIVAVTKLADANDNIIVAALQIDGFGNIELIDANDNSYINTKTTNVLLSSYGKDAYDKWMEKHKDKMIYDTDEGIIKKRVNGKWVQSPNAINSSVNNITTNDSKSQIAIPSKYNMQQEQKNIPIRKDIPKNPTKESSYDIPTKEDLVKDKVQQKVVNKSREAIGKATKTATNYLQLKQSEVKTLRQDLNKYLGYSKEDLTNSKTYNDVREEVKQFMEREIEYLDEDLKNVKNEIRNTKIKITPELKNQITDFNDFKKENFGRLRLSNEGQNVDSVYEELSSSYPYYFSSDVNTEADMLYELSEFMDKNDKMVQKYNLDDETIENATSKIFNAIRNNSLSNAEIEAIQNELEAKYSKKTRKVVQETLLKEMGLSEEDISKGKDIIALDFQRTDPIRLNEKVFGHEIGNKVNDATIRKTKHNEADRIRFLNKEREDIKNLGIKARSKESAAVQKYAEKEYVTEHGDIKPYGDIELAEEFEDIATQGKIKKAANVLRNKYDRYIDQINSVITEMGYDPIPKRKDYMRHFQEIGDKLSEWGIPLNPSDMSKDTIPTDINGITDQFKPGKNWFASAMQRTGVKTVYDAITGIDGYLEGASNLMYHTEDIQRYRALSKFIRETYGQQHGLENVDLGTEEGQKRLKDIYDAKLSKYVAWLDEQANALAGKKGGIDRAAERLLGRKIYTILETAKKQVGSNMTGFNVRSALTNFASAVQGASKTNKKAFLKGTISTINNIIHNDGLINKSDFLTSRFGSDTLSKKLWQKASNAGQILMTGSDYFTANQIWRSKYYENLSKGMNETQAIKNADDFASRIMGDRSKGSTAEIFNSKTLGLLTQFQLEVNNQWSSIIHDNKMDIQSGNKSGATVMFQLGQLAALSYFFNNIMKSLTGSDVMIDPIDMLKKLLGAEDDDKEKTLEERATEVLGDLANDLPFASVMNGGRIPMAEAFNGAGTAFKKLTGQKDKYGNDIEWKDVGKDLITSGAYWLLPTGYGQLNKTTKGLSMYDTEKIVNNLSQDVDIAKKYLDDNKVKYGAGDNILQLAEKHGIKEYLNQVVVPGSYTDSGNLRFTADESTSGKIKAALFGQYSTDEGRKYRESNYKTIEFPHIKEMKDLDMKASEYRNYRTKLSEAGRKDIEKIEYIKKSDYSEKQKNIMYKNVLDMKPEELTRVNNLMNISEQNRYMIAKSKSNSINSNENLSSEEKHKQIAQSIIDTNINNKAMAYLYSKFYSTEEMMDSLSAVNIPIKEFIKYNSQNLKSDYDSRTGKAISGSREKKVISYINSLNLSIPQKALLIKLEYNSYNTYNSDILKYITSSDANYINKAYLVKRAGFSNYNKEIINYVQKNYKTATEKEKILKSLGFNIKNGRVYY